MTVVRSDAAPRGGPVLNSIGASPRLSDADAMTLDVVVAAQNIRGAVRCGHDVVCRKAECFISAS